MKYLPRVAAFAVCLLALAPAARSADPARQQPALLERNVKVTLKYLLYLPKDYAQKQSWPLMLFLHGAGERGDNLEQLKQHGPPRLIEAGYDNPELYDWLLQQKRSDQKALLAQATKPIDFDIHNGYFVSNKFEPNAPTSFVVLKDQKSFDEVFGAAFVMHDKSHRLPPQAFDTQFVVAAIHRGKAMWEYKVQSVTAQGPTLIVNYTTTATPQATAEFACPLILSIAKGNYTAVQFVEDGKPVASK